MPGLVPGIHVFLSCRTKDVDGRDKPGHDDEDRASAPVAHPGYVYDDKLDEGAAASVGANASIQT
jgi:hypothetical protein